MIGLIVLDYTQNFWEANPQFKLVAPFKFLYEEDKSKKKSDSSTMMWFTVYCYYPLSIFHKLDEDEKHSLIGEDYCGSISYYTEHKSTLDMLIQNFSNMCLSPMQRQLLELEMLLNKRAAFIRQQDYTFENAKDLDAMVKATAEIYKNFKTIVDDLAKEDVAGVAKGGSMPSLND